MAMSLEESEKEVRIMHIHADTYQFVKKIAKIGLVDPEIIGLKLKNKKINESKIYSLVSKFAERAR